MVAVYHKCRVIISLKLVFLGDLWFFSKYGTTRVFVAEVKMDLLVPEALCEGTS